MRVLVTGGTGVIGAGLIPELLAGGHRIRLLARGAEEASREWPAAVESFQADVTHGGELRGAADGCDAVVHITGIVAETPPEITFERVNVGGTRNLLKEASRAGQPKFVFISSLAAERGASAYHKSKRDAEALVREYGGPWVILRPGNVYGPGDEVISQLLSMQRTLPAIPMIGSGTHNFQPIWYIDLGKAIRRARSMLRWAAASTSLPVKRSPVPTTSSTVLSEGRAVLRCDCLSRSSSLLSRPVSRKRLGCRSPLTCLSFR